MHLSPFLMALASIALSVLAQFLLKAGMTQVSLAGPGQAPPASALGNLPAALSNPSVLAGFAAYGLGAVVWLRVLSEFEVSKAYPMVGLGFVLAAVVGWWLGEALTVQRAAGVLLICLGVALVGRS